MHASNDDGKIAERIAGMAPVRLPDSLPGENGAEGFRDLAECRTVPQRVVVRAAQLIGSIVFRQFGNRCSVYGGSAPGLPETRTAAPDKRYRR